MQIMDFVSVPGLWQHW